MLLKIPKFYQVYVLESISLYLKELLEISLLGVVEKLNSHHTLNNLILRSALKDDGKDRWRYSSPRIPLAINL